MTLCFKEAFIAARSGKINEEEYLNNLLAHFRNVRHPPDTELPDIDASFAKNNPYAESIRQFAVFTTYDPFDDKEPVESLFKACLVDNISEVKSYLAVLSESNNNHVLLPPLGTLAAEKGHAAILQMCLEQGLTFDQQLDRAIEIGFYRSSDMVHVLEAAQWRDIQNAQGSQQAIDEIVRPSLKVKAQAEEDVNEETYEERHKRLVRTGMHGPGTCKTGAELEKLFGHLDW
jgi:hypothetical protein